MAGLLWSRRGAVSCTSKLGNLADIVLTGNGAFVVGAGVVKDWAVDDCAVEGGGDLVYQERDNDESETGKPLHGELERLVTFFLGGSFCRLRSSISKGLSECT